MPLVIIQFTILSPTLHAHFVIFVGAQFSHCPYSVKRSLQFEIVKTHTKKRILFAIEGSVKRILHTQFQFKISFVGMNFLTELTIKKVFNFYEQLMNGLIKKFQKEF